MDENRMELAPPEPTVIVASAVIPLYIDTLDEAEDAADTPNGATACAVKVYAV
jgi:hypothetical protein